MKLVDKLKSKTGKTLAALALTGAILIPNSGCYVNRKIALGHSMRSLSALPKTGPVNPWASYIVNAAGNSLVTQGAAEESRSNVHVHVNGNGMPQYANVVREKSGELFPAQGYRWVDSNDNENLRVVKVEKNTSNHPPYNLSWQLGGNTVSAIEDGSKRWQVRSTFPIGGVKPTNRGTYILTSKDGGHGIELEGKTGRSLRKW